MEVAGTRVLVFGCSIAATVETPLSLEPFVSISRVVRFRYNGCVVVAPE